MTELSEEDKPLLQNKVQERIKDMVEFDDYNFGKIIDRESDKIVKAYVKTDEFKQLIIEQIKIEIETTQIITDEIATYITAMISKKLK